MWGHRAGAQHPNRSTGPARAGRWQPTARRHQVGEVSRVTPGRSTLCWGPSHLFQQGVSPARLHPPWRCSASRLPGPGPAATRTSSPTLLAQPDRSRSPRPPAPQPPGAGSGGGRKAGREEGRARPEGCRAWGRVPLTAARHQNPGCPARDDERRRRWLGCGATVAAAGTSCLERWTGKRTGRRGWIQLGTGGCERGSGSRPSEARCVGRGAGLGPANTAWALVVFCGLWDLLLHPLLRAAVVPRPALLPRLPRRVPAALPHSSAAGRRARPGLEFDPLGKGWPRRDPSGFGGPRAPEAAHPGLPELARESTVSVVPFELEVKQVIV